MGESDEEVEAEINIGKSVHHARSKQNDDEEQELERDQESRDDPKISREPKSQARNQHKERRSSASSSHPQRKRPSKARAVTRSSQTLTKWEVAEHHRALAQPQLNQSIKRNRKTKSIRGRTSPTQKQRKVATSKQLYYRRNDPNDASSSPHSSSSRYDSDLSSVGMPTARPQPQLHQRLRFEPHPRTNSTHSSYSPLPLYDGEVRIRLLSSSPLPENERSSDAMVEENAKDKHPLLTRLQALIRNEHRSPGKL